MKDKVIVWTDGPRLAWKQNGGCVDELCETVRYFVKIKRIIILFTEGQVEFLHDKILNMLTL